MSDSILALVWPARPACHDDDFQAQRFGQSEWRQPREHETFRTCSYCGSVHPEDLHAALSITTIARPLGGSDWKYGWPHKFYVECILNPRVGQTIWQGSSSYPVCRCRTCGTEWDSKGENRDCPKCGTTYAHAEVIGRKEDPIIGTAPQTLFAKFYSVHLRDLDAATFDALAALIERHAHIKFRLSDGRLAYSAPHGGYQV